MAEKSDLPLYPLQEVLEVKIRRVEDAEKVVKEKIKALQDEEEKLKKRKEERDKVLHHYNDKLLQLRQEYDAGTTSDKIDRAKIYIKVVQERLKSEEKKVKDQQQQVGVAEKNLEIARNHLKERQREQDKIEMHKKEWEKATLKDIDLLQTREEDEVGSTMFLSKYMQQNKNKKNQEE